MNGVGGICGGGIDGEPTIISCVNIGDVSGAIAGGIKGLGYATIKTCYNTGEISGTTVGGICGEGYCETVTILNCYNCGGISGSQEGGIIGRAWLGDDSEVPTIKNSYSTEYVLIGSTELSGTATEAEITNSEGSLTADSLKAKVSALNIDIETDVYYLEDTNSINNGYPILSWQE